MKVLILVWHGMAQDLSTFTYVDIFYIIVINCLEMGSR